MSRRPSTVSITSQSVGNGDVSQSLVLPHDATLSKVYEKNVPRSPQASFSVKSGLQLPSDPLSLDPDELFTKYTIAEMKLVQQRLRTEADAKQEELRLMVGERYRDLLQASSSIISIALSAKRVTQALEEAREVIVTQDKMALPKRASLTEEHDTDLHSMQLLSAHMKLLLDAPEHLWRLIEKKKYFSAAWLYLLIRVVHHALVRDEQDEEVTWSGQGLDVLEQFPLIQRQWDAVSQFRSQIIHKATISLREIETSAEDVCGTLLSLYFLDSRPLNETLSVFLAQRVKTLYTKLAWVSELSTSNTDQYTSNPRHNNGHRPEDDEFVDNKYTGFRRAPVQEVKQALLAVLDVAFRTVKTARDIFELDPLTRSSMVIQALTCIQSDSQSPTPPESLSLELQLTTQKLLATLPSSPHSLLLPPNLRFYKPYVDLTSSSSCVPQAQLAEKLDTWFRDSIRELHTAAGHWISNLRSVTEVWNVRSSIWKWIKAASGLQESETVHLKLIFDDLCHKRLLGIWKSALADAEKSFGAKLESAISVLATCESAELADTSPVEGLFRIPPLPNPSLASLGPLSMDPSFQKYKSILRRQLMGRTLLMDQVLSTLENCARTLQQDLSRVFSDEGDDTRILTEQFAEAYRPDAEALCLGIIKILNTKASNLMNDSDTINGLIFAGGIADALSLSSFLENLNCEESRAHHFQSEMRALRDAIVDRWQQHTISKIVREYWKNVRLQSESLMSLSPMPAEPSSCLIYSFLSLSSAIQQLGIYQDPSRRQDIAQKALYCFITELVNDGAEMESCWEIGGAQALSDLALLHKLASLWGEKLNNVCESLAEKWCQVHGAATSHDEYLEKASEYLSRTQTLFATLLPPCLNAGRSFNDAGDKSATFLSYGLPGLDQAFRSAVQVATPSSRFGLLLVEHG